MQIPKAEREPCTAEELDPVLSALRERILSAQGKYKGSYNVVDLKADLFEELLDAIAYCVLMAMRVARALPDFEGETSNEWVERTEPWYTH